MKIVLPVSSSDVQLFENLIEVIKALGGVTKHQVLILPTSSVHQKGIEAAEVLPCSCTVSTTRSMCRRNLRAVL